MPLEIMRFFSPILHTFWLDIQSLMFVRRFFFLFHRIVAIKKIPSRPRYPCPAIVAAVSTTVMKWLRRCRRRIWRSCPGMVTCGLCNPHYPAGGDTRVTAAHLSDLIQLPVAYIRQRASLQPACYHIFVRAQHCSINHAIKS
jgi:hypothetical protein